MKLKVDIGFDQLMDAVKQLPESQLEILKAELNKRPEKSLVQTDFQKFLLNFPVMDKEQYKAYKQIRKELNQWRTK